MRSFIDKIIDVLYPPGPDQIDRGPPLPKILVILTLALLLAIGILARL